MKSDTYSLEMQECRYSHSKGFGQPSPAQYRQSVASLKTRLCIYRKCDRAKGYTKNCRTVPKLPTEEEAETNQLWDGTISVESQQHSSHQGSQGIHLERLTGGSGDSCYWNVGKSPNGLPARTYGRSTQNI